MKKIYEKLDMFVVSFEEEDILTMSPGGGGFDNVFDDNDETWDNVTF